MTSTRNLPLVILTALLVFAGALNGAEETAKAPLRFGGVRYAGEDTSESTVHMMAGYLERALRSPVEVRLFQDYSEIVPVIAAGELDIAILPPVVFFQAQEDAGVRPIATPVYQNPDANYRGVILSRGGDPDITTLADLKGRKIAFVSPLSASGYIIPRGLLRQAGLRGEDAYQEVFTGNHVDSVKALIDGKVDAAATFDMLLAETPAIGKSLEDFVVLAQSDPIPGEVLVGSKDLNPEKAVWLRSILLAFGERRRTDDALQDCLYQWFLGYEAERFDSLRKIWKASR